MCLVGVGCWLSVMDFPKFAAFSDRTNRKPKFFSQGDNKIANWFTWVGTWMHSNICSDALKINFVDWTVAVTTELNGEKKF